MKDAYEISEARARALASELADRLKGDLYKDYEVELAPVATWLEEKSNPRKGKD